MSNALRWAILPAAAVGTLAGVGVVTGGVGSTAVMAALADPAAVLAARSPGARPAGALTQTKRRKASTPEERVLSTALTRPLDRFAAPGGGDAPGTATGPVGDTVADAVADTGTPAATAEGAVPGLIAGGFIGTPGGIVVSPDVGGAPGGSGIGGGGGGGGTSTTTPTTPTTPVTPTNPVEPAAVPEPGTWLTLLAGFGAVGGALRSRRRSTAASRLRLN